MGGPKALILEIQIRNEGDLIPEGFSITNSHPSGRFHMHYREEDKIISFGIPRSLDSSVEEIAANSYCDLDFVSIIQKRRI